MRTGMRETRGSGGPAGGSSSEAEAEEESSGAPPPPSSSAWRVEGAPASAAAAAAASSSSSSAGEGGTGTLRMRSTTWEVYPSGRAHVGKARGSGGTEAGEPRGGGSCAGPATTARATSTRGGAMRAPELRRRSPASFPPAAAAAPPSFSGLERRTAIATQAGRAKAGRDAAESGAPGESGGWGGRESPRASSTREARLGPGTTS